MTMAQKIVQEFRELSVAEKVTVAEQLWSELEGQLDAAPASEAEANFLRERLAAIGTDARPDISWSTLRADLK